MSPERKEQLKKKFVSEVDRQCAAASAHLTQHEREAVRMLAYEFIALAKVHVNLARAAGYNRAEAVKLVQAAVQHVTIMLSELLGMSCALDDDEKTAQAEEKEVAP
jgi:hypothetical protein